MHEARARRCTRGFAKRGHVPAARRSGRARPSPPARRPRSSIPAGAVSVQLLHRSPPGRAEAFGPDALRRMAELDERRRRPPRRTTSGRTRRCAARRSGAKPASRNSSASTRPARKPSRCSRVSVSNDVVAERRRARRDRSRRRAFAPSRRAAQARPPVAHGASRAAGRHPSRRRRGAAARRPRAPTRSSRRSGRAARTRRRVAPPRRDTATPRRRRSARPSARARSSSGA